MNWSIHAARRVTARLSDVISPDEIERKITGVHFDIGETWVKVKMLSSKRYIQDGNYIIKGDTVYVIYRRRDAYDTGSIATVELRGAGQTVKGDRLIDLT